MQHYTYYLIKILIKLKGIKKIFSNSPIDFRKLRKDDIHVPKSKDVYGLKIESIKVEQSVVTEILPKEVLSKRVIMFCHGGASIYGPTDIHWNSIAKLTKETGVKSYLIDYPKAPEHQIKEMNDNVDAVYDYLKHLHGAQNIILLGDSMGGTLLILLTQRLIKIKSPLPNKIILLSPVLDASMTNAEIERIEKKDIMLSRIGIISAKAMCAGNKNLKSSEISPLYGSFKNFIPTYLFIAENDIMRPDEILFVEKLRDENVFLEVFEGKGMLHIWAFLPVMKDAKMALNKIINVIKMEK